MKTDLVGMGGEWRMRVRDGGVGTVGGDGNETGGISDEEGGKKSATGIGASLIPDFGDKEESNNVFA